MIFDYIITLKQRSYKWVDMISHLLLFISVVSFGMFSFEKKMNLFYLIICALIVIWWIYIIWQKRSKNVVYFRFALMLCAIGWMFEPYRQIGFAILYAVAAIIEKQVKFPEEIGFSEESIVFNSFPKKTYSWNDVLNVVLKDNLLTVDFKNNKLVQKEIDEEVSSHVEIEFNEFCRGRLMTDNRPPTTVDRTG